MWPLLLALPLAHADAGGVLAVAGSDKPHYRRAAASLGESLGQRVELVLAPYALGEDSASRTLVALGPRGVAHVAAQNPAYPYVATLISRHDYDQLFKGDTSLTHPRATLFVDQPVLRQAALVHRLVPAIHRLGILIDERRELILPATAGIDLVVHRIPRDGNVVRELEVLLREVDGLLAVPDPVAMSRHSIHGVLLSAYRLGKPVVGYSKPLVKAGALLSAYSSPELLGEDTAVLVRQVIDGDSTLAKFHQPRRFQVAVNRGIARVLGIASIDSGIENRVFETVPTGP